VSKSDLDTWRARLHGALTTAPVMTFLYYLVDNFRHKDCISIEEHRTAISEWIEAVKACAQWYSNSGL